MMESVPFDMVLNYISWFKLKIAIVTWNWIRIQILIQSEDKTYDTYFKPVLSTHHLTTMVTKIAIV